MILCVCKGVSDRRVRAVVDEGCQTVKDVGEACHAGTDCGVCARSIRELIDVRRRERVPALAAK